MDRHDSFRVEGEVHDESDLYHLMYCEFFKAATCLTPLFSERFVYTVLDDIFQPETVVKIDRAAPKQTNSDCGL